MALSPDVVGLSSDNAQVAHIWSYKYRLPSVWHSFQDSIAEDKAAIEQQEEVRDADIGSVDPSS